MRSSREMPNADVRRGPQHPALRGSRADDMQQPPPQRPRSAPITLPGTLQASAIDADFDGKWPGFGDRFSAQAIDEAETSESRARESRAQPELPATSPEPAKPDARAIDEGLALQAAARARQRRIAALSRYGVTPQTLMGAVPYCLRVTRRKRALREQLRAHTRSRAQLELMADQALWGLGEALYARRSTPELRALGAQLRAVYAAQDGAADHASQSKQIAETRKREFAALSQAVDQRRNLLAPIEQHAREIEERLARGHTRVRALEERMHSLEDEQRSLENSTDAQSLARVEALEAARLAALHELQTLQLELFPLEEDQKQLQAEIAQHTAATIELQEQQARLMDAVERDEEHKKGTHDNARSAYRDALAALAQAALHANLAQVASQAAAQYVAAEAPISSAQEHEGLLSAAIDSYEAAAYRRGFQLIIAGTVVLLAALCALIAIR